MAATRKSWQDRLASYPHLPNVKPIPEAMRARRVGDTIGHTVVQRGKRFFVEDYERRLI